MSLPNTLSLDSVQLTVSNLDRSIAFYQHSLGFKLHRREADTAYLGAGRTDRLALTEQPGAKRVPRTTGLYHFAILVPSRLELAQVLNRLTETQTPVEGFSDHLVSEAIYLPDPDGNGIEIYRDRPRAEWRDEHGNFRMGTDPLDLESVLAELNGPSETWHGFPPETGLGHLHLHVRQILEAQNFYCNILGFDLMMNIGSALFVSAGGYHHHLGLNVWAGVGAPPPPPNSVGLRSFVIRLPNRNEVDQVLDRLRAANVSIEENAQGWFFRDPSQNGLILQTSEV